MSLISFLLHEDLFGAVLITAGTLILFKRRHLQASIAILFFIAGWFATEIPLLAGYAATDIEKFTAQSTISLCLICLYVSLDAKITLLIATINEVLLLLINVLFMLYDWPAWYHWFAFGVINWASLIALCYNYGSSERVSKRSGTLDSPAKAQYLVLRGLERDSSEVPAMATKKR